MSAIGLCTLFFRCRRVSTLACILHYFPPESGFALSFGPELTAQHLWSSNCERLCSTEVSVMAKKRSAWLVLPLFVLATSPVFAQWSSRTDTASVGPNYIPEGTRFMVKLDDTLDTKKLQPGKKFKAKLSEDLVAPNGTTIPAGKKIKAHVSDIDRGVHGRILISFDEI